MNINKYKFDKQVNRLKNICKMFDNINEENNKSEEIQTDFTKTKKLIQGSMYTSVQNSVCDSVWVSVRDYVYGSIRESVYDSVRVSVDESVLGSVRVSVGVTVSNFVWRSMWESTDEFVQK